MNFYVQAVDTDTAAVVMDTAVADMVVPAQSKSSRSSRAVQVVDTDTAAEVTDTAAADMVVPVQSKSSRSSMAVQVSP